MTKFEKKKKKIKTLARASPRISRHTLAIDDDVGYSPALIVTFYGLTSQTVVVPERKGKKGSHTRDHALARAHMVAMVSRDKCATRVTGPTASIMSEHP